MKAIWFLLIIAFLSIHNSVLGQSLNANAIVTSMNKALDQYDNRQYKAQMFFKEFSSDTFEVRNFLISHRNNLENSNYGYDWKVSEKLKPQYTLTYIVLPDTLYIIYDGKKVMGVHKLKDVIEPGAYMETMRNYFILEENFAPFTNNSNQEFSVIDSNNHYYLTRKVNDNASRVLVLNKYTFLLVRNISTIKIPDFDLTQILEVNFDYENSGTELPDSIFSPGYYMSLGYTPRYFNNDQAKQEDIFSISNENQKLLLDFPFVSDIGDTTIIRALQGKYILMDFWYSSCLPCLKSMPMLDTLAEKYANSGLLVLGINCIDTDNFSFIDAKLRQKKINFPLLFGPNKILQSLKINTFPTCLLLLPNGNVEYVNGNVFDVEKRLERIFEN